tara:strand:+ start:566 stop:985 length:420 start_codon:yes stop_codon:yes gene_type:complete
MANNTIDYITVATTGNAADFGDLTAIWYRNGGMSDTTRGIMSGGYGHGGGVASNNIMEYITIGTLGNATDFGDLQTGVMWPSAASNGTLGVIAGGNAGTDASANYINTINKCTIQTPANCTDFGDLLVARSKGGGLSGA